MRRKEADMAIELTEQQCKSLESQKTGIVEMIDPASGQVYVLVAAENFANVQRLLGPTPALPPSFPEVPPGIKRSQEALRRDLPQLLENKKLFHQWVAYHGDQRIGIARTETELIKECIRRG